MAYLLLTLRIWWRHGQRAFLTVRIAFLTLRIWWLIRRRQFWTISLRRHSHWLGFSSSHRPGEWAAQWTVFLGVFSILILRYRRLEAK